MSFSGGKQKSSSSTTMLTPEQMQGYFNRGAQNIGGFIPGGASGDAYDAPVQQTMTGGDYAKLEGDVLKGFTAPLDYAKAKDIENFNNSAGAKGIWSSGLALKGEQDINEGYAPQYAAVGGAATQSALGAKQAELSQGNQMALANAMADEQAKWRTANFLSELWLGSKGSNSQSKSSAWNFEAKPLPK